MATKKGQQSIMANQALIQASRGTGEQFIDYGAVMQPAITGILKEMEIADNKMDRFINALPPGANIEKLPEGMRPEVERYLRDAKEEYAAAADVASKLSPRDPGYREAIDKMNSIKTGFINLNKNLESHLANRVEFIQDKDDLSTSLNYNDNKFLTSVYAGDYDGFKVTGGELEFFDKAKGKHVRTPDFPQYSLTDVVGADGIAKLYDEERNLGFKNLGWDPKRSGRKINRLFKKIGNQGVIDMAFDGFDEYDGNYIDTVVKEQVAPKMSMEDWLVSDQRENLKTKEGFAPYRQGFETFISEVVKDGWDEGNTAYTNQINIIKPGSKQAGFEATNKAIDALVAKDNITLNDLLSITLPSDRKFRKDPETNEFLVVMSDGVTEIEGTRFKVGDKKAMRNSLQFAAGVESQYRTTEEIKPFKSKFDFTAGLPSGNTEWTTEFIKD
jgi:hypothetical protein